MIWIKPMRTLMTKYRMGITIVLILNSLSHCYGQPKGKCIINEIKCEKEVLKYNDTLMPLNFIFYKSDSLGQKSAFGEFFYFRYKEFEFLLDTIGLYVTDSVLKIRCKLNIQLEIMYVSKDMVFKNTFFSKMKHQSLVVKFKNTCLNYRKWKVIRKYKNKSKKIEIVSSYC